MIGVADWRGWSRRRTMTVNDVLVIGDAAPVGDDDGAGMKVMQLQLSGELAAAIDAMVAAGWFADESELARLALTEYLQRHRFELLEKHQREDIRWALDQQSPSR